MSHSEIKITVDKNELLETLKKNLEKHRNMYKESLDGFKKFARSVLESKLAELDRGNVSSLSVSFAPPTDHTKDYERAIEMMQWEQRHAIELTSEDFSSLVQDDWAWIGAWLASNKRYSKSVTEYAGTKGV